MQNFNYKRFIPHKKNGKHKPAHAGFIFGMIAVAVIVSSVLIVNYFTMAWTEPTLAPPGGSGSALTSEQDPTVPASIKDGISWNEVSSKPAGFADGVDNVGLTSIPPFCNDATHALKWNGTSFVCGTVTASYSGICYCIQCRNTYGTWGAAQCGSFGNWTGVSGAPLTGVDDVSYCRIRLYGC